MIKFFNVLLSVASVFICLSSAYADKSNFDVSAGLGMLTGDTASEIGNYDDIYHGIDPYFPKNRVDFPLNVYMGSIAFHSRIMDRFFINAEAQKNISSDAGHMKITDWGNFPYDYDPLLDVGTICINCADRKSESEAELDAIIADINFRYKFYDISYDSDFGKGGLDFFVGAGYIYQKFKYDYSDMEEWYPYGHAEEHGFPERLYISGDIGTYDITYDIPYIEFAVEETVGKLGVELSIGYSAWARAKDEHENNYFPSPWNWTSTGECDGEAVLISLTGRYDFSSHWFLLIQYDGRKIKTDGEQITENYPVYMYNNSGIVVELYSGKIDQEIESTQSSYYISAGFGF